MPGFGWGGRWGAGEAAWLCALLFLSTTSSPRGIRDTLPHSPPRTPPPSDFLALHTALSQEVAEILMCCQSRRSEAAFTTVSSYDCHATVPMDDFTPLCGT